MAVRNEYDVGIIFSNNTNLIPALESVLSLKGKGSCEVATWHDVGMPPRAISVPGHRVWVHQLSRVDYGHVHDPTDYTKPTRRR